VFNVVQDDIVPLITATEPTITAITGTFRGSPDFTGQSSSSSRDKDGTIESDQFSEHPRDHGFRQSDIAADGRPARNVLALFPAMDAQIDRGAGSTSTRDSRRYRRTEFPSADNRTERRAPSPTT